MPPVRPDLSTLGLYQDPQAHSSSRTRVGVSSSNLHRRHTADGRVRRDGTGTRHSPHIPTPVPGFHNKPTKNGDNTNPINRIPGFQCKHSVDGTKSSSNEAENNPGGVSEIAGGGADISPLPLQTDRQDECGQSSRPTSTSVLQIPTNGSGRSAEEIGYDTRLRLSEDSKEELTWWDTKMVRWNGKTILTRDPELIIESDASTQGWGATCQGSDTGGPWSAQEKSRHINCLELLAATLALKTFVKNKTRLYQCCSSWTTLQQ